MSRFNQWLAQVPADELVAQLNARKASLQQGLEKPTATGEELLETARDIRAYAQVTRFVETLISQARKAAANDD